ncbi:MAG: TonB-dependent receptor [Pseudomonadota bacterium]
MFTTKPCGGPLPLALGCLIVSASAYAQDPVVIEEIIVTAQKREQALEDVPVSVAVIDSDFIDRQDIRDLTDYLDLVPGLTGETAGASGDGVTVRIRGIGSLGGNTNTFGVYVDGFDTTGASTALAGSRLVDPERVEVLRGPQGTAFGRNVVAGAISITSLTPDTEAFRGRVAVDAGNNGVLGISGRANIPLSDTAALLISGFYDETDGYIDNLTPTGSPEDSQENYGVRASLQIDPTDSLSIKASLSYEELSQKLQSEIPNGANNPLVQDFIDIINLGFNPLATPASIASPLAEFFPDQAEFGESDTPEFIERQNTIGTLNVAYDLGESSLIWVTGFSYTELDSAGDGDYSSLNNVLFTSEGDDLFASTELRYQSNGNERFNYVGGIFVSYGESEVFNESFAGNTIQATTFIPGPLLGPAAPFLPNPYFTVPTAPGELLARNNNESETFGYALFADFDLAITDRWNLLFGGRYNYDEEEQDTRLLIDIQQIGFPGIPSVPFAPSVPFPDASGEVDFDKFTWRLSSVFDLSERVNLYATISTGYRPGALQLSNVDLSGQTEQLDFAPEEIINYEVGIKANFFDNRLLVNLSGFLLDWTDIQLSLADPTTGAPFAGNGEAEASGFELDFTALPFAGLSLQGGVAYLDSEVQSLDGGIAGAALVGNPLPYAPRWQATLTGSYDFAITEALDGFVRGTFVYVDERGDVLAGGDAQFTLDSYERLDVRAGIEREGSWRIEGFLTNATDEAYATGAFTNGFAVRGQILRVAPPRQYGLRLVGEF